MCRHPSPAEILPGRCRTRAATTEVRAIQPGAPQKKSARDGALRSHSARTRPAPGHDPARNRSATYPCPPPGRSRLRKNPPPAAGKARVTRADLDVREEFGLVEA